MNLDQAREFVRAWRDDDEELRIPMSDWGHQLAEAIDLVLLNTAVPAAKVKLNLPNPRIPPKVYAMWAAQGIEAELHRGRRPMAMRGILLITDATGHVYDGELSSKVPAHEIIEVVAGSGLHDHYSDRRI